jgi:AraC-like DNA-binding protein
MDLNLGVAASLPPGVRVHFIEMAPKRSRGEALRAARLHRIRAYVHAQQADPDLSAPAAARALGMSVRSLHLALAPTGCSFGDLVQRTRLASCHAMLARPGCSDTIADIAFACGFNSLSSFYRARRRCCGPWSHDMEAVKLKLAA